jgi:hypothetical protein
MPPIELCAPPRLTPHLTADISSFKSVKGYTLSVLIHAVH